MAVRRKKRRAKSGAIIPEEHDEQKGVIEWVNLAGNLYPELAGLYAIPNGGARTGIQGALMKAEGAKAGVWDLSLPVARDEIPTMEDELYCDRYHSLWIEMKRSSRDNHLSPNQIEFGEFLHKHGNATCLCYSAQEAIDTLVAYLTYQPLKYLWKPEYGKSNLKHIRCTGIRKNSDHS